MASFIILSALLYGLVRVISHPVSDWETALRWAARRPALAPVPMKIKILEPTVEEVVAVAKPRRTRAKAKVAA
jgi:hypothetical protein